MRSCCYQELDQLCTFNQKLALHVENRPRACYRQETHQIVISERAMNHASESAIRAALLWERHNAKSRDRFQHIGDLRPSATTPPEMVRRMRASYALAVEWYERVKAVECDLRAETIKNGPEMRQAGVSVARRFAPHFQEKEQSWYQFTNCLEMQIHADPAHPTMYDQSAREPDWVGRRILALVQQENATSLIIKQDQVRDWQQRKMTNIEAPFDNSFLSLSAGVMR